MKKGDKLELCDCILINTLNLKNEVLFYKTKYKPNAKIKLKGCGKHIIL